MNDPLRDTLEIRVPATPDDGDPVWLDVGTPAVVRRRDNGAVHAELPNGRPVVDWRLRCRVPDFPDEWGVWWEEWTRLAALSSITRVDWHSQDLETLVPVSRELGGFANHYDPNEGHDP